MAKKSEIFSRNLRRLRGIRTQRQFAVELGLLQPTYSRYESGLVPGYADLSKLAAKLKIDPPERLLQPIEEPSKAEIVLSEKLTEWAEITAEKRGFSSVDEYISYLIRRDKERDEEIQRIHLTSGARIETPEIVRESAPDVSSSIEGAKPKKARSRKS